LRIVASGLDAVGEAEPRVVADAVVERVPPGEDVGVRGQRDHVLGVDLVEAHAAAARRSIQGVSTLALP
jgi:hypothetical protein